jgi:TusA-related sulfurtransferase
MADEVAKAVVDAIGESCPVSVNSLDGASCQPGPLGFGSAVLPVSLEKEDDSSSEASAWAWKRKKVGASLPKGSALPVDTTGGASCPDSPSLMEVFDKIEPIACSTDGAHCQEAIALMEEEEETARAAKRKWQEEWKGPAAGGSNMEKGPRAHLNKMKKERKDRNYLKKIALDEARRDAEYRGSG